MIEINWRAAIRDPRARTGFASVCATIDSILVEIMNDPNKIIAFPKVDPENCSRQHLTAALSIGSARRFDRISWSAALLACIDAHALAGIDSREALRDLLAIDAHPSQS